MTSCAKYSWPLVSAFTGQRYQLVCCQRTRTSQRQTSSMHSRRPRWYLAKSSQKFCARQVTAHATASCKAHIGSCIMCARPATCCVTNVQSQLLLAQSLVVICSPVDGEGGSSSFNSPVLLSAWQRLAGQCLNLAVVCSHYLQFTHNGANLIFVRSCFQVSSRQTSTS